VVEEVVFPNNWWLEHPQISAYFSDLALLDLVLVLEATGRQSGLNQEFFAPEPGGEGLLRLSYQR
jgi:hypothetical protein